LSLKYRFLKSCDGEPNYQRIKKLVVTQFRAMELKCPTVGHENPGFTGVNGRLLEIPMANPPIRASRLGGG
jgi:hypothetical protein